jgi:type IV secretion system protein VirD4
MIHWAALLGPAALGATALGLTFAVAAKTAYQRRPKETPNVYGDARFMNDAELKASGLRVDSQPPHTNGVYLGAWRDRKGVAHYLRDASNGHTLICGPTRSGKGISCILPTLLSWHGSAVVHDEKGELWEQTAPWRERHIGPVIKWEPGAMSGTSSWNPLSDVRLHTPHETADAQNIALMLIDVRGHGLDRVDHWQKASIPVLAGCVLHELYLAGPARREASLPEIAAWFADPSTTSDDLWREMRDNTHLVAGTVPHPGIAAAGRAQLDRSDRERSSVTSALLTHLTLFFDQIVATNTTYSDFTLHDLADRDKPVTIYLTALPNDTVRLRPLIRLFLTMALRSLMSPTLSYVDGQAVSPHRHETLMLLDEFISCGKLEEVEADLARAAAWGVKFLLVVQDITQLNGIYGLGHSIVANTHTRAFFPTNDLATARLLSDSTGTMTAQTPHTTIMGRRIGFMGQVTKSIQPTARPLMTPGEILAMPGPTKDTTGRITDPGDMLLFLMGHRPLRAQQMLYFRDPEFAARAQPAPAPLRLPAPPLQLSWKPALPPP